MNGTGVKVIGTILLFVGITSSYCNSFLIMHTINATTFMWVLWVMALSMIVVGSALSALVKNAEGK
jgi:hypothetical protein